MKNALHGSLVGHHLSTVQPVSAPPLMKVEAVRSRERSEPELPDPTSVGIVQHLIFKSWMGDGRLPQRDRGEEG
jgi:hypothetical protein